MLITVQRPATNKNLDGGRGRSIPAIDKASSRQKKVKRRGDSTQLPRYEVSFELQGKIAYLRRMPQNHRLQPGNSVKCSSAQSAKGTSGGALFAHVCLVTRCLGGALGWCHGAKAVTLTVALFFMVEFRGSNS